MRKEERDGEDGIGSKKFKNDADVEGDEEVCMGEEEAEGTTVEKIRTEREREKRMLEE